MSNKRQEELIIEEMDRQTVLYEAENELKEIMGICTFGKDE